MRPSSSAHCFVVSANYFGLLFVLFLEFSFALNKLWYCSRLCLVWGFLLNWDISGGAGGRGEPHSIRYKVCVPPQRVGLNSRFYLKTGVDFVHYSLKSGMVIKRAYSQLSHNGHQEKFPAFLLSF